MPHSSKWTKLNSFIQSQHNIFRCTISTQVRPSTPIKEMTLPPQRQWKGKKRYPEHQHQIKSLTWSTKLPTSILWTKKRQKRENDVGMKNCVLIEKMKKGKPNCWTWRYKRETCNFFSTYMITWQEMFCGQRLNENNKLQKIWLRVIEFFMTDC